MNRPELDRFNRPELERSVSSPPTLLTDEAGHKMSASARAALALKRQLSDEFWTAGDRLPSEPALAKQLGVSRVSLRAALGQLENEGLITRRHGSGTYVNSVRPLVRSLHQNVGADQLIRSTGHLPGIAEMSWRRDEANEQVAGCLGLPVGAPIIDLYRVRTSDNTPVTIEHDYFSSDLVPPGPLTIGASLYSFLSQTCGIDIVFGVANLEPGVVGSEFAPVFGVEPHELCMIIKQIDYTESEQPVSYSIEHHLASAFDFQLVRLGPTNPAGS